jgi:hypothetical protein
MLARSFIRLLGLTAVIVSLFATSARAQELQLGANEAMNGATASASQTRGGYAGVRAGGDQTPAIAAKPGTTPAVITWPGFQMQPDGGSRVFLQSTSPINAQAAMANDRLLIVDLGDAGVAGPNNRRPLYTSFFNTPVTRVEIKRTKKRITLELTLRAPVQPRISSEQAKSGYYFVYIDFPPGTYVAAAAPPAPSAPPPPPVSGAIDLDHPSSVPDENGGVSARASTAMDGELPPGVAKPKAKTRAKTNAGFKLGSK